MTGYERHGHVPIFFLYLGLSPFIGKLPEYFARNNQGHASGNNQEHAWNNQEHARNNQEHARK
jgi:hypothetical protein